MNTYEIAVQTIQTTLKINDTEINVDNAVMVINGVVARLGGLARKFEERAASTQYVEPTVAPSEIATKLQ